MSTNPYKTINKNNYYIKDNDASNKVNALKNKELSFKSDNSLKKNSSQHQLQNQSQRNKKNI